MIHRCDKCGFKIRGKNHDKGVHHLSKSRERHKEVNSATNKKREPWSNVSKRKPR